MLVINLQCKAIKRKYYSLPSVGYGACVFSVMFGWCTKHLNQHLPNDYKAIFFSFWYVTCTEDIADEAAEIDGKTKRSHRASKLI